MIDQARPRFAVSPGARPAAERYAARHGLPQPDWRLRDRAVSRFRPTGEAAMLSPREHREAEAWRAAFFGPDPAVVAAVRFLRRHRRRARWAVRLRLTRLELGLYSVAWAVAMLAWAS